MPTQEHVLQERIVSYLRLRKFIVIDCDVMDGLKYCKDSIRFAFINHHKKRMGYVKGQPDLIVMKKGQVWALELKSVKGKQSKEQKEYQKIFEENEIPYIVVKQIEDLDCLDNMEERG